MKKVFLLLLLIVMPSIAHAQEATSLSLVEAQQLALSQHPLVKSSDFDTEAAKETVKAVRSAYLPQISGNAVQAFADDNTRIAATNGLSDPTIIDRGSIGLTLSQLITDFGKTSALVDASHYTYRAEQAKALSAKDKTLLNVTKAYYQVLRGQSMLEVAKETRKSRVSLSDRIKALHDVKMKSDLDLSLAQQGVAEADLLILKAQTAIDDGMSALSEAIGDDGNHVFKLQNPGTSQKPPIDVEALLAQALAANPELNAASAQLKVAQARAKEAGKEFLPTVAAYGYAGETPYRQDDDRIDRQYATAGVNISMPFYTGGKLTAQDKAEELHAKSAQEQLNLRRNEITRDVHTLFNDVQTAYKNIALTDTLLKNARQSYELIRARYQTGNSSIVDLTEAQLAETQSEINHANASYDYLLLLAQLDFTTGKSTL